MVRKSILQPYNKIMIDRHSLMNYINSVKLDNSVNPLRTMGVKARREREKEQLRQEIIDAARELFAKEGYEKVTMRNIADKIEYSPTTIYLYFKDKTELLFAICDETFAKLTKKMKTLLADGDNPVECLRKGCRAYVDFGLKHPNHYKITFINHPDLHLGKEHYLREGSTGMECYGSMGVAVQRCIDANLLNETDAEAVSQSLWAMIHGVTALLITKPDFPWVKKDRLIDMTINAGINGFLA